MGVSQQEADYHKQYILELRERIAIKQDSGVPLTAEEQREQNRWMQEVDNHREAFERLQSDCAQGFHRDCKEIGRK